MYGEVIVCLNKCIKYVLENIESNIYKEKNKYLFSFMFTFIFLDLILR